MQDKERDEILIELKTDMCWVKKMLNNHLQTHRHLAIALTSIVGGLVTALIIALVI